MYGMRTSRIGFAAVTTLALLLAGCADSEPRRDAVANTATRLLNAVRDGDGAAACAVLAPGSVTELQRSAGTSCPEAVLAAQLPIPGPVQRVDVYGQWARVVRDGDTEFLAVFPGGWRVVAAGCRSRGERPYECAVQGD
jgi:ketosteroid isomerase-like protein